MKTLGEAVQSVNTTYGRTDSPIEVILLQEMIRNKRFIICKTIDEVMGAGYFVVPQSTVGKYRADFIVICQGWPANKPNIWPPRKTVKIAVECDGKDFHTLPDQKEYDRIRDEYFLSEGIKTIRFTGGEIVRSATICVNGLVSFLDDEMSS